MECASAEYFPVDVTVKDMPTKANPTGGETIDILRHEEFDELDT